MIAAGRKSKTSSTACTILSGSTFSVPKGLHQQRDRAGHPDGVGHLDLAARGCPRCDNMLGDPAGRVSRRAVDLGRGPCRESAAAMAAHPAVGVDDDLAAGHTGVAMRPTNHELPGRVDVIRERPVDQVGWQYRIDDFFLDAGSTISACETSGWCWVETTTVSIRIGV